MSEFANQSRATSQQCGDMAVVPQGKHCRKQQQEQTQMNEIRSELGGRVAFEAGTGIQVQQPEDMAVRTAEM
jgi:hypothetical protein